MGKLFAFKNRNGLLKQSKFDDELSQKKQMDGDGLYKQFFENSAEGMYRVSPEGKFIIANPAAARILGYESPEDLINSVLDITSQIYANPADRERAIEMLKKDGFFENFEVQNRRKDGSLVWVMASVHVVRDAQGNVLCHEGTSKDITEIKEAQIKLVELERKFRTIANFTHDWENWIGTDGKPVWISFSVERITGYSVSECMEMPDYPMPMIHPEDRDRCREAKQMANEKPINNIEFRMIKKNGDLMWGAVSTNPVLTEAGSKAGHRSSIRDITERKIAEDALRLSGFYYHQLYESMMDGFVSGNFHGYGMDANEAFLKMIGYSREELSGINYKKITPEKWHALDETIIKEQILARGYSDIFEKEFVRKDGIIIPVELRTTLFKDENGNPLGFWAIVRDISERKKAEKQLKESETKYRKLHHSMMDGFANINMQGRLIEFNESFHNMLGYSPEELRQLGFRKITPEKWHEFEDTVIREQLFTRGYSDVYEKEYICKDGTVFPVELHAVLLRDEEGNPVSVWAIIRDITIRKRETERLTKSEEIHRLIAENVTDFIALVDKNGIVQQASDAKDILGYEKNELNRLKGADVVHPKDIVMLKNLFQEYARKRLLEVTFESRIRHKDGHYVPIEVRARPLIDENDNFIGNVFTGRHITKRKNLGGEALLSVSPHLKDRRITDREREVLKWIMDGKSTWEIARILNISESTVKFHADNIMKKFNAVNRTHAVAIFLQSQ